MLASGYIIHCNEKKKAVKAYCGLTIATNDGAGRCFPGVAVGINRLYKRTYRSFRRPYSFFRFKVLHIKCSSELFWRPFSGYEFTSENAVASEESTCCETVIIQGMRCVWYCPSRRCPECVTGSFRESFSTSALDMYKGSPPHCYTRACLWDKLCTFVQGLWERATSIDDNNEEKGWYCFCRLHVFSDSY